MLLTNHPATLKPSQSLTLKIVVKRFMSFRLYTLIVDMLHNVVAAYSNLRYIKLKILFKLKEICIILTPTLGYNHFILFFAKEYKQLFSLGTLNHYIWINIKQC
jgi:hypothetical protein